MSDHQREQIRGIGIPTQLILLLMFVALIASAPMVHAQGAASLSKAFAPASIGPGAVSTATFTINNFTASPVTDLAFTDVLPAEVTIADPANASTTCSNAVLSAPDGGNTITFSDGDLGGGSTCFVFVDVTSSTPGVHTNPAINLNYNEDGGDPPSSEPVDLTVVTNLPGFSKSFAPSSVALGGRSTLTFTIDNTANASRVGSLDFVDILPSGMVIADPSNASTNCISASAPDTTLTALPGTGIITLDANGSTFSPGFEVLPAGATCTVTVDVVTTGAGALDNVSGDLLADFVIAGRASATLDVTVTPLAIAKDFNDDPVPPGGTVTLDFTIENFDRNFSATGVAFTDDLAAALAGLTYSSLISNDCGGSVSGLGTTTITFTGGTLAPEGTCTIGTGLSVPSGATPGSYTNTTGAVSATIGGSPVVGNMASDQLFVAAAPVLTKEFVGDPINPGDTVDIRFTITNTSATSMATDIEFIDELTTFLPFPVSVTLPPVPDPPCGAGSSLALVSVGTDRQGLELTGGSLAAAGMAGDSCTFDVTIAVPSGQPPGVYLNTTEEITATVSGETVIGKPASDTLTVIAAPQLTKAFTDDPVAPGGTVTLEFTLSHSSNAGTDATGITFTDDLSLALTGLTANLPPTPDPPCGAGSSLTGSAGDTLLTLMGGTLSPGASCTFSVTLNVPVGAVPGSYTNTTSGVSATVSGQAATSAPASDDLEISGLVFSKEFLGDPAFPGETLTLRFTIANVHPTDNATITFFTDNLAADLAGLAATGPPSSDDCGGTLSGTTFLTYVGGSVNSGVTCNIEVPVLVPLAAADDSYLNVTSSLSTSLGTIDPAVDTLIVDSNLLQLTKEFTDDPVAPGDTVTLEFILTNLDAAQPASMIDFTDDLGAALAGLTFDSVLFNDCGATVSGTGTDMIIVTGASLAMGGTCTIRASLTVPGGATDGIYINTTTAVTGDIGGFPASGDPANDGLEVLNLLTFSKSFDGPTTAGGPSVLTFTITNPGAAAASELGFSDDLNGVISGLTATNLPLSDVCGPGSQLSGTSFIIMTGGNLPPMGGTCSFSVDLLVPGTATAGSFPNTTSDLLQAGLAVSPPATADLVVEPPPTFAKAFAPVAVGFGGISTLTFTIDNTASALAATGLDFTDNLPVGMVVATPANASTTCTGGTLTAIDGSGVISYTGGSVAAGATCTVQADVMGAASGALLNTTGDLTSSSGNSGPASATLNVSGGAPAIGKSFGSSTVVQGGTTTLSFTITNTDLLASATAITFTDDLDAALPGMVATDTPLTDPCGAGSQLTGTSLLTLTGGTLAPGASCNFTVTVSIPDTAAPGLFTNTSSAVSATVGGTPVAGDPADAAQDSITVLAAAAAAIPTLSQWGLLLLVMLMSTAGVLILRRY